MGVLRSVVLTGVVLLTGCGPSTLIYSNRDPSFDLAFSNLYLVADEPPGAGDIAVHLQKLLTERGVTVHVHEGETRTFQAFLERISAARAEGILILDAVQPKMGVWKAHIEYDVALIDLREGKIVWRGSVETGEEARMTEKFAMQLVEQFEVDGLLERGEPAGKTAAATRRPWF